MSIRVINRLPCVQKLDSDSFYSMIFSIESSISINFGKATKAEHVKSVKGTLTFSIYYCRNGFPYFSYKHGIWWTTKMQKIIKNVYQTIIITKVCSLLTLHSKVPY